MGGGLVTLNEELTELDRYARRNRIMRRVGMVATIVGVFVLIGYILYSGGQREREIDALQAIASRSDSAATEVAQERQDQARSVKELCESGAIEQDDAGKAVCDEARVTAEENPEEVVEAASGPEGPKGAKGDRGLAGKDGAKGDRGPAGETGEQGEQGPIGATGPQGDQGISGLPGDKGDIGAQGDPGPLGPVGAAGDPGSDGEPGAPGADGNPGARGEPGGTGEQGPIGATGPAGPAGPAGPPGEPGADGTDGDDGTSGPPGRGIESATCSPDTGRWTIEYTDETTGDGGPCIATPEAPATPPEPTEEVTE